MDIASQPPRKRFFFNWPPASPLSRREKIRTALMASLAIFLAGWIGSQTIDGGGLKTLLASLGIKTEDLRAALAEMHEFIDVGERELNEIYKLAAARAFRREFGETTAAEVMTPDPLTVEFGTELEETWSLMRQHRIKALPDIDRGRHVIGIVTQSDFFRHARARQFKSLNGKLKELLKPSPTVTSQKPEVAGQIMTTPAVTAAEKQHLPELARLLTELGIHQVPIVDGRNKLAGMITQTDLIAVLYSSMTGTPNRDTLNP